MISLRKLLPLGGAFAALLLSSCGFNNSVVSLDYQPELGQGVKGPAVVGVGRFGDFRQQGDYYLGTVRSAIGTPMETVNARIPVNTLVRNAFAHALSSRHMLASKDSAPYLISGEILELEGLQILHPTVHVRLRVNLVHVDDGHILFSRIYEFKRSGDTYIPGSGSPVPAMRDLLSRVLQNVVDQAVDDRGLRSKIKSVPPTPSYSSPPAVN
jgi:hypothetical protein